MVKRIRPTVGQVRELERRLSEAVEAHKLQVTENKHLLEEISYLNGSVGDLEKRLWDQVEGTSLLIQEARGWRSDYLELLRKYNGVLSRCEMEADDDVRAELNALRQSNNLMEGELRLQRSISDHLQSERDGLRHEVEYLKKRPFWKRVFNG